MSALLVLFLSAVTILPLDATQVESVPGAFSTPDPLSDPMLFFIIDFGDFMCPACLDSLLSLCRLLPNHFLRERACGIVVLPHSYSGSVKIMEQKIRGFKKANRIAFPLFLDRDHIFRSLSGEGTSVVLFHPNAGSILKISFPLNASDTARLLKIWIPEDTIDSWPDIDNQCQELYSL